MWIVNSDPCFFPNAQPNYWQVFEGANQGGLLIISEHLSLWWGNEEGLYLFLWACTQLQTSGASQKGAPARTPWAKRPNVTLQSFEIPQYRYNKCRFHTRAGSRPEDQPTWKKLPSHSFALCLGHLKTSGVAPSQVKNIYLFSKFWLRQFNQFISLSSDVNFLGQLLVELGTAKWGQFLMRWNSKEMRLKTNHSYITVIQRSPVPSRLTAEWKAHRHFT